MTYDLRQLPKWTGTHQIPLLFDVDPTQTMQQADSDNGENDSPREIEGEFNDPDGSSSSYESAPRAVGPKSATTVTMSKSQPRQRRSRPKQTE